MTQQECELSPDQASAVQAILNWREKWPDSRQTFTLGGLAGTGKTTILSHLIDRLSSPALAAPTGKAAQRLREAGVHASTIHSLIYSPLHDRNGKVSYRRRACLDAETICIDEASMVNAEVNKDLLRFAVPILYVGDHGQLEPIGPNPNIMKNPDVRLEVIHRQAAGNPILRLAMAFREGREVPRWRDMEGRCIITSKDQFAQYEDIGLQQIVGFNRTRHELNARTRSRNGFLQSDPCPGEKLICLRNNKRYGLFNGQQMTCRHSKARLGTIELELELDDGTTIWAPALRQQFGRNTFEDYRDQSVLLMDFGYALTAHRAQGSEYEGVVVLEEIFGNWDARRWRYTATTRARERIVYCR